MHRIRVRHRLAMSLAVLVGCGGLLAASVASAATPARAHKKSCALVKGKAVPQILTPCNGATIDVAHDRNFTIIVYDPNPLAHKFHPFVFMDRGRIKPGSGDGIDQEMKARPGHPDEYYYNTKGEPNDSFPGFWRVTSGAYKLQVRQGFETTDASPVETVHLHA